MLVCDLNADAVAALASDGATGAASFADLVAKLDAPRSVWVMVPAGGITGRVIAELAAKGITLLDCGTSGGVWGLDRGYCLMIGDDSPTGARLDPIFRTIAPGAGDVERTPGRTGATTSEELGYLHCGRTGAGHFVKMVHNGIEYGLIAAIDEGVPRPVLTSALFTRFASRDANDFADKVLSAMRKGFGGHEEKKT